MVFPSRYLKYCMNPKKSFICWAFHSWKFIFILFFSVYFYLYFFMRETFRILYISQMNEIFIKCSLRDLFAYFGPHTENAHWNKNMKYLLWNFWIKICHLPFLIFSTKENQTLSNIKLKHLKFPDIICWCCDVVMLWCCDVVL